MAIKTVHTSDLQDYIKKHKSFEMIWNENKTGLLAFFNPYGIPKQQFLFRLEFLLQFLPQKQIQKVIIILLIIYYIIYILRRILTEVKFKIIHSPKGFPIGSAATSKKRSCRWTTKWRFQTIKEWKIFLDRVSKIRHQAFVDVKGERTVSLFSSRIQPIPT